jgi:hypothetical protein
VFAVGGPESKRVNEGVIGIDEIELTLWMFGDAVWGNGFVVDAPANPGWVGVAGVSETADGVEAIDGFRMRLFVGTVLPTLSEAQTEDRDAIMAAAINGDQAFLVEGAGNVVVEEALLPERMNALEHLAVARNVFPKGGLALERNDRKVAGDPNDFDLDVGIILG